MALEFNSNLEEKNPKNEVGIQQNKYMIINNIQDYLNNLLPKENNKVTDKQLNSLSNIQKKLSTLNNASLQSILKSLDKKSNYEDATAMISKQISLLKLNLKPDFNLGERLKELFKYPEINQKGEIEKAMKTIILTEFFDTFWTGITKNNPNYTNQFNQNKNIIKNQLLENNKLPIGFDAKSGKIYQVDLREAYNLTQTDLNQIVSLDLTLSQNHLLEIGDNKIKVFAYLLGNPDKNINEGMSDIDNKWLDSKLSPKTIEETAYDYIKKQKTTESLNLPHPSIVEKVIVGFIKKYHDKEMMREFDKLLGNDNENKINSNEYTEIINSFNSDNIKKISKLMIKNSLGKERGEIDITGDILGISNSNKSTYLIAWILLMFQNIIEDEGPEQINKMLHDL